jgi:hypothetical protein
VEDAQQLPDVVELRSKPERHEACRKDCPESHSVRRLAVARGDEGRNEYARELAGRRLT